MLYFLGFIAAVSKHRPRSAGSSGARNLLVLRQRFLLVLCAALPACNHDKPDTTPLTVVVRTTPAAWHFDSGKTRGIDHDLLGQFAEFLGVEVQVNHVISTSAAFDSLCNPDAQLAVGMLTAPMSASDNFHLTPRYDTFRPQLLYRFDHPRPTSAGDLVMKDIEVGDEPAHLKALTDVKQRNADLTRWKLRPDLSPLELIEALDQGLIEYTVADSHAVAMSRNFYPRIKEAFDIGDALPLHWVFGSCADPGTVAAADAFFARISTDRTLAQILDRYYGHTTQLDYPEKLTFIKNVDQRLGKYRDLFIASARQHHLDWQLLAAISYQESHWNPQARSPSGVQGLMMLTLENARQLNVDDRHDPAQNIDAGTHFLLNIKQRLPATVREPDRTWFALAAYNAGPRYVERAMEKARARGLNPALWINIRDLLNRAADKKSGGAGTRRSLNNPHNYVYNVRAYRDLLAWLEGSLSFQTPEQTPHTISFPPATL